MPVPVVVVGNVTVGGSGKTPLVLWLAQQLKGAGLQPGIISRGYGGMARETMEVRPDSDPRLAGDEPVLLARNSACPVWVGLDRVAAAHALLAARPACDVLISDDGLQHYRLARQVEIAVVDGERRFGNGFLLPAGPLREGPSRLAKVDAVVVNGGSGAAPQGIQPVFTMQLAGNVFYNLAEPSRCVQADFFVGQVLHAVAGIAHPGRFFDYLRGLGLSVSEHPFPDHHPFTANDLNFSGQVLMTEKDGVKCTGFAQENCWALAVEAEVSANLAQLVADKVRECNGQQTA